MSRETFEFTVLLEERFEINFNICSGFLLFFLRFFVK